MLEMALALAIGLTMAGIAQHPARTWKQAFLQAWGRGSSLPLRIALGVLVVALCATHSRMGNFAFAVSLLSIALLAVSRSPGSARALFVLFASIVLIDVVLVGGFFGAEKLAERIQSTSFQDVEDRNAAARTALQIIRDYPLLGTGGGTFYVAFPAYRTPSIRNFYEYAHNDYAQTFAECGLVGICSIGLAIIMTLAAAWRAQRRAESLMRAMSAASIMGCTALLVHSWADFNLQIPANAIFFVFLAAVGWVCLHLPAAPEAGSRAANDT
jgi:O-antigen ligase